MGNFYTNITLRGADRKELVEYLRRLGRVAFVSPHYGEFVTVYDRACEQNNEAVKGLSSQLAERCSCPVLAVMNHDDDVLLYWLYSGGKLLDEYVFPAEASAQADPGRDFGSAGWGGNPQILSSKFGVGASEESVGTVLTDPDIGYPFAVQRHLALLEALGIDARFAVLSFDAIDRGEAPEDDFVAVGLSPHARAELRGISETLKREGLKAEGLLLLEIKGAAPKKLTGPLELRRRRLPPVPSWCAFPRTAAFLLAWKDVKSSSCPVVRYAPPWTGSPEPAGIEVDTRLSTWRVDPTESYLAVGYASGNWSAELWSLAEGRPLLNIPHSNAVFGAAFSPERDLLVTLSWELSVTSVGDRKVLGQVPALPTANVLALHPAGRFAVVGAQDRVLLVDVEKRRAIRTLFVGGRQDLSASLEAMLPELEKQGIPKAMLDQLLSGALRGPERIFDLLFDDAGDRLFAATDSGVRAFEWEAVCNASEELPESVLEASPGRSDAPSGGRTPESLGDPSIEKGPSITYSLAHDPIRDVLLFSSSNGSVCFLDLSAGRTGTLLELAFDVRIDRVGLSADRRALLCRIMEPPSKAALQVWDYEKLWGRVA